MLKKCSLHTTNDSHILLLNKLTQKKTRTQMSSHSKQTINETPQKNGWVYFQGLLNTITNTTTNTTTRPPLRPPLRPTPTTTNTEDH